jgi:hypothetical protein
VIKKLHAPCKMAASAREPVSCCLLATHLPLPACFFQLAISRGRISVCRPASISIGVTYPGALCKTHVVVVLHVGMNQALCNLFVQRRSRPNAFALERFAPAFQLSIRLRIVWRSPHMCHARDPIPSTDTLDFIGGLRFGSIASSQRLPPVAPQTGEEPGIPPLRSVVSCQVPATRNGSHLSCNLETTYETRSAGLRKPADSRPKQEKQDSQKARSPRAFPLKTHATQTSGKI